ncbi:MAG: DUF89 family protein [Phycisphaerae bacterium]|nr:DUF89 family protein [Phycisphaerae bacterium]
MRTVLECIPCFLRQTLGAVRLAGGDAECQERVMRAVLREAADFDRTLSPPAMGQRIHRLIRAELGGRDPYAEIKRQHNEFALNLYPELRERVLAAENSLEAAVRLAIAGNAIDMGVNSHVDVDQVAKIVEQALAVPLSGDVAEFAAAIDQARDILFLADNAGEIVFDRLLLEQLPLEKVTVAVRGRPVINDATRTDADEVGITALVPVIDNGADVPGTILGECDPAFRRRFDESDLIIAKGQGNYETLNDVPKNIYFVFMAKCQVVARHLNCDVGSMILRRAVGVAEQTATR